MSDDRYNDPSRHPMHNPLHGGGDEEEKTQMVDINQFNNPPGPQFAPPPTMDPGEATQLFEIPPSMSGGDDEMMSSAPDYGSMSSAPDYGGGMGGGMGGGSQVFVGGDDAGYDGNTQFVNIADFARQDAHYTPEQQEAGYDGNTQFVDINALMGGAQMGGGDAIDSDKVLQQGYQFSPEDIQRGDVTLIHAKNPLGKDVILKRVWEGDPQSMTTPLRQRVAQLHELRHPNLIAMNGMFVSDSGMWVELDAPRGKTLTALLENQGKMTKDMVFQWVQPMVDVLTLVHTNQLAYANLTTDSVWIDPANGIVQLEPFDMLRLADRGNLGAFGPPEMDVPPDQRQLSPATDVYSLAAVIGAALTGLPFQSGNLANLEDKKLAAKLQTALSPQPGERFPSTEEFAAAIIKGGGPDIKIIGAAAAALLLVVVIAAALMGGDSNGGQDHSVAHEQQAYHDDDRRQDSPPRADEAAQAQEESPPSVDLPGQVTRDPRLDITKSFALNPPVETVKDADEDALDAWRKEAAEHIAKGDSARRNNDKWEHYDPALQLLTRVIRAQDNPPESDWQAWRDLHDKSIVREEVDRIRTSIDELLVEGRLRPVSARYRQLARRDPSANADSFFSAHNNAVIVELSPAAPSDD